MIVIVIVIVNRCYTSQCSVAGVYVFVSWSATAAYAVGMQPQATAGRPRTNTRMAAGSRQFIMRR